jgi:redox-sensitive bicupin YhaK (pirin superfamily)
MDTNTQNHLRICPDDFAWELFDDPHGRPTTPVRVLRMNDPYILEADFPPNFYAGLHWHPHDTIYLITAGSMRFGDEGVFTAGEVRWVRGGHAYGPETAGPGGVRFHLISLGGPVGLNWADLYEVPEALTERLKTFDAWYGRLTPGATAKDWPRAGVRVEVLSNSHPHVQRIELDAGACLPAHPVVSDTLAYIRRGIVEVDSEARYLSGDLRFGRAQSVMGVMRAVDGPAEVLLIGIGGALDRAVDETA